jgi:biotin transport system substrate-specific component
MSPHSNIVTVPAVRNLAAVRILGVVGFAAATALAAQVCIPLPFTPVPITLQSLVVLLAGVTLGARYGTLSMALYVGVGSLGYHGFAGGAYGLATLLGPTGGYLLGFMLAQPILGMLTRGRAACGTTGSQEAASRGRLVLALLAAKLAIFACGLVWLHVWLSATTGATVQHTLALGLWPFLPGMAFKLAAAFAVAGLLPKTWRAYFEN